MENNLFVISGLSGSGKTTIIDSLLLKIPSLKKVITCTTRSPRGSEKNGVDYKFVSKEEFEKWIKNNELIEYAKVYENYYGSLKIDVEKSLKQNNVIISVDVQGAVTFKKVFPNSKLIFIDVPLNEIEKRLRKRGTDSKEIIEKRLVIAKKNLLIKKILIMLLKILTLIKQLMK